MGIAKAMLEKVMVVISRYVDGSKTVICAIRYGNVMASRGSVIPLFIEQIKAGKPITITDPSMTRFLMSLEEAVELVMYDFQHAQPGDIFIQKAPACTIETLALALKEIFKANNPIKQIGTRHGEKLYETLLTHKEVSRAKDLGTYYKIPAENRDVNYDKYSVETNATLTSGFQFKQYQLIE